MGKMLRIIKPVDVFSPGDGRQANRRVRALARAEEAGLHMLGPGRGGFLPRVLKARRLVLVAMDTDTESDVAAVWMRRRNYRPAAATFVCTYVRSAGVWRPLGASDMTFDSGFLQGRRSAAVSGPASLLVLEGSGGVLSGPRSDRVWIGYQIIHVAAEVAYLLVGNRKVTIPDHGYVITAWRTAAYGGPSHGRPRIVAHASTGVELSSLDADGIVDRAVWDSSL